MKNFTNLFKAPKGIKNKDSRLLGILFGISLLTILVQLVYLNLRFAFLLDEIPLFYSKVWGDAQLAPKSDIFLIPATSIFITLAGSLFFYYVGTHFYKFGTKLIFFLVSFCNLLLTASLFRIVHLSLGTSVPLIAENYVYLFVPFFAALLASLFLSPSYVKLMTSWGVVTDPNRHSHPAMILKNPSVRGGGLLFALVFIVVSIFFLPLTTKIIGILLFSLFLAIFGFLDDFQNTHSRSKLSFLENPLIRLGCLVFFVSLVYFFDIKISFLSNPLNGVLHLDTLGFSLGDVVIKPLSWVFTTVWIVWILNLLSWSNGVDGQYSGIVGISLIFLGLLALRQDFPTPADFSYARLAVIGAGVVFGLVGVTWHPSKLMWGFGAMSAGVVVAALSVLVQAKVITSILILLIPFLDGLITVIRRVARGKNPLKGDRGHLHHLLMQKGLSVPQVALFYWLATLLFGGLSLYSAGKPLVQTFLMLLGILFFIIVLANVKLPTKKLPLQEFEK